MTALLATAGSSKMVIPVIAKRYEYQPDEIQIPAGVLVELHIRSQDVTHGFSIPDLQIRADLVPGKTSIIKIPALQKGSYEFSCDVFCGSSHSDMQGRLVVK